MTTTINQSDGTRHHAGGIDDTTDPDPEAPERARGPRRFPAAYKAILAEYEGLFKADKGALWASSALTDIHHERHSPRKDVHNGDHGKEEAPSPSVVHSGVQS